VEAFFTPAKKSSFSGKKWNLFFTVLEALLLLVSIYWWSEKHLPNPGIAVALMGLAAAAMSIHNDMDDLRKFFWLLIIALLLSAEVRAIGKDRNESHAQYLKDRKAQDDAFGIIQQDQKVEFSQIVAGFGSTQQKVDGVLKTTEQVAGVSKENLLNLTGGDSYAYVYPSPIEGALDTVMLKIHNDGSQVLTSVRVDIQRIVNRARLSIKHADVITEYRRPIEVGTLAAKEGRIIPQPEGNLPVLLDPDGTAEYQVYINSQARGVKEAIDFRLDPVQRGLEYKITVWRGIDPKLRKKGDVFDPEDKAVGFAC